MLQKDLISILIVEDEPNARVLMGRIAERHSNKIYYAQNGIEGVECFVKHLPDIVITDIKMPTMDGLTMIQQIEETGHKRPVVILATAYSEAEYFIKAIELKVDHLMIKPIEADMLNEKIEKSAHNLQITKENWRLRTLLDIQTKKVDTIFNFQHNIVILSDGKDIKNANLAFLSFFGFDSMDHFIQTNTSLQDFFIAGDGFLSPNQSLDIQKLITHENNKEFLVKMYDRKRESERIFVIKAAIYPGEDQLYIISFTDISEIENNRKLLKTIATTDKLTKIFNRFKFDEVLSVEISRSRRYKSHLSLIVFDIDLFKNINDKYGHDVGDILLEDLTNIVKNIIRSNDAFARWGGDEFAIILPSTSLENAVILAEKIREAIQKNCFNMPEQITISIGIAEYTSPDSELELLKRADTMLYKSKALGRNQTCSE